MSSAEPGPSGLTQDEATVLTLLVIEKMNYREAATAMGRSCQETLLTIREALHRARDMYELEGT